MKVSGSFVFEADQQAVWNLLMDTQAIAKALPGVDRLIPIAGEDMAWRAAAKIEIASVSGTYTGFIRMTDLLPLDQYRLTVTGEGKQSIINGSALLKLHYDPEKCQTILTWEADAKIAGKLASVGQRLISAAAVMLGKMFFRKLAEQLPASADQSAKGGEEEAQTG